MENWLEKLGGKIRLENLVENLVENWVENWLEKLGGQIRWKI